MTSIQRNAVLAISVFSTFAIAQTLAIAQQNQQPNNPPVPSQTTNTPPAVRDSAAPALTEPAPMTKREMRAQRKRQKQVEKAADANAKARKYDAKALKQDNKSTNAAEKANNPQ